MGRKKNNWVWILKDATLAYRKPQIDKFIDLWNDNEPIANIADHYGKPIYDMALLVIHCELEGLIKPRPGGLLGDQTRPSRYKQGLERKS